MDAHGPRICLKGAVRVNIFMNMVIKVEHGSCVLGKSMDNTTLMDILENVGVGKSKKLHQRWVKWATQAWELRNYKKILRWNNY